MNENNESSNKSLVRPQLEYCTWIHWTIERKSKPWSGFIANHNDTVQRTAGSLNWIIWLTEKIKRRPYRNTQNIRTPYNSKCRGSILCGNRKVTNDYKFKGKAKVTEMKFLQRLSRSRTHSWKVSRSWFHSDMKRQLGVKENWESFL